MFYLNFEQYNKYYSLKRIVINHDEYLYDRLIEVVEDDIKSIDIQK